MADTGKKAKRKPRPFEPATLYFHSNPLRLTGKKIVAARGQAPDYITADVAPEVAKFKPCDRKAKDKKLHGCHVELAFIGNRISKREGVAPGSYLRVCTKYRQPGLLIPVAGRADALEKSRAVCACQAAGGTRKACAVQAGATQLGGKGRR